MKSIAVGHNPLNIPPVRVLAGVVLLCVVRTHEHLQLLVDIGEVKIWSYSSTSHIYVHHLFSLYAFVHSY